MSDNHKLIARLQSRVAIQTSALNQTHNEIAAYEKQLAGTNDVDAVRMLNAIISKLATKLMRQTDALKVTQYELELQRQLNQGDPAQLPLPAAQAPRKGK